VVQALQAYKDHHDGELQKVKSFYNKSNRKFLFEQMMHQYLDIIHQLEQKYPPRDIDRTLREAMARNHTTLMQMQW
jgi:hypothetical protein